MMALLIAPGIGIILDYIMLAAMIMPMLTSMVNKIIQKLTYYTQVYSNQRSRAVLIKKTFNEVKDSNIFGKLFEG